MIENEAYLYLSAAGDFSISQVVDIVKGVHRMIRKGDFTATDRLAESRVSSRWESHGA